MTDIHLRILRLLATQRQRELDDDDAAEHTGDGGSAGRRRELAHVAGRTRAGVAAPEARRRNPPATRGR